MSGASEDGPLDVHRAYGLWWIYAGTDHHRCRVALTRWGAYRVLRAELRKRGLLW